MIASAEWKQQMTFDARLDSGHTITFDGAADHAAGPSPMETVLGALCVCTSIDVVSILQKKREPITGLTVSANAERQKESPSIFTRIHLTYRIRGKVAKKAAEDAVSLSKNKYCSVSKMLEKCADVHYSIEYAD